MNQLKRVPYFLGLLLVSIAGYSQIVTDGIEVKEGANTILQAEGIDKAIIDSEGLLLNGSFSLDSTRHGRVYVASNTIQETHEFDLNELFPKLDIGQPNIVMMVKVSAIVIRRGVDETVAFDMILLYHTGTWYSSSQQKANRGLYASGWAYGSGYGDKVIIRGHGEKYMVAGTIEVIIHGA